ncbi:YjjG family noncanonical pyrimidine nucleotidase [Flavobacterium sp. SUN046]|uniref:YjjG family noncanonical pyrimidine nucleotidase n=1 Tax=Flavobacterium sp. SUN046 TaxID=3002440 RepID=UPI002DBA2E9A|nr:YjjG family noncanonical pyrimidine nucleotidase [Flavobacterium sp. SUN046]MEC4049710.1 YjjG family noncanonical pyrimidine nucleotidase [Flavobacterium sp. SUN046]
MENTSIQHIFFDLDHTLWDFEKNSALAFETVLKKHQIAVDLNDFLYHYVPLNLIYWEKYRNEEVTQAQLRYGRLKDTFDLMSYQIDDAMIDILSTEYIHYLPQFNYLFEGAIEVLDYLKSKYQLHIITNGFEEVQSKKIRNSNIEHYFITITNSETAGVKKPNPLIFEYALNAAKADKANSIMIGDCIDADVKGALSFGMDAIHFNESNIEIADHIKQINHLLELKKYL